MIKFRITEEDENHDSFRIASIQAPEGMTQDQAEEIIATAWGEFQESKPNASSDFGAWLDEHHGFVEVEDDFVPFAVGD